MAKPVILAVDDDPEVLGAVERDLKQHYRSDYRVLKSGSGAEALEAARQLKERGTPVALFLVDERMPGMSGTELLREAIKLHPESRRVLLTAYADTQAAISGINDVGLDHYLLKPWDPPGERLYPVLDDLLSDWTARVRLPYDGIRVAGARSSPRSYAVKEFLSSNHVPYQWIDVDQDPPTRELIRTSGDAARLPVVFFPDGTRLVAPTNRDLAEKVGMQTRALLPFYDLAIVGGGPAGLAAAVYGASEGLRTVLIEQSAPGGQAGTSSKIENYLGFPSGVSGADLARRATAQARRFGAEVIAQEAVALRLEDPFRVVRLADGTDLSCKAVVLATGVSVRMLEVPGVESLLGIGVYYGAAMTEAATYRAQDVCIVGAGNSAGQGALFFSRYARRVTMLVRGTSLAASMSRYLVDRIAVTPNIEVVAGAEVVAVCGTGRLEKVVVRRAPGEERTELEAAAMFIFIGARPRTEMLAGLLELDEKGYVKTGHDLSSEGRRPRGWTLDRDPFAFETSVPGIFAAGDVRAGSSKRVAAAVGEGSGTVGVVHTYLETV
ncbi:MAG TPA: FAD-dependent oxidoreductase [Thermoanaerobaculia bacterium]|nr:FAD-dependent oxidoreductase [Thermoanaerobaculia bacterium]